MWISCAGKGEATEKEAPTQVLAPIREENAGLYFFSNVELKWAGRVVRTSAAGLGETAKWVSAERELWALRSPPFTGCTFNPALAPLCGVYSLAWV